MPYENEYSQLIPCKINIQDNPGMFIIKSKKSVFDLHGFFIVVTYKVCNE